MQQATFGAGCFWGVEAAFREIPGVLKTTVGFMGGTTENPSYHDVCTGNTGHAEVLQLEFDPEKISYDDLLKIFWEIHNPTTLNRQGPDVGSQYRSVIFFHGTEQEKAAHISKEKLEQLKKYPRPIVTQILPAKMFYRAEEYHQQYFEKNGSAQCHILPGEKD